MVSQLRVMSFNIWVDGVYGGQPLERTAEVIERCQADVVGMQEVLNNTEKIANMLGWHFLQQAWDTAILSRFPVVELTARHKGARVELGDGRHFYLCNVHLAHAPYQPYQLLKIPYADAPFIDTEAEAIAAASAARGEETEAIIRDAAAAADAVPVFVTGDFNEPSHLDWTEAAARMGHHPLKVAYPTSKAMAEAGFLDSYRQLHPDEAANPGYTWPTVEAATETDKDDRLDFVLYRGHGVRPERFEIVGGDGRYSDITIENYPSDHRAVLATFSID